MTRNTFAVVSLGVVAAVSALAQAERHPPKVLHIYREEIKQGRNSAHEKTESDYARMLARNKYPVLQIAMTSVSGPNEAWFLETHNSFASISDIDAMEDKNPAMKAEMDKLDAMDGELRASSRSVIAVFRPDLSYHPDAMAASFPKMRYMSVFTVRTRPGTSMRLPEMMKSYFAVMEKANIEEPSATYQIVAGGSEDTFLVFQAMESLKVWDMEEQHEKAMMESGGMEEMAKFMKGISEITAGTDTQVFSLNPKMSYVTKDWAGSETDFWFPKMPAKAPSAAKPAAKPGEKAGQ